MFYGFSCENCVNLIEGENSMNADEIRLHAVSVDEQNTFDWMHYMSIWIKALFWEYFAIFGNWFPNLGSGSFVNEGNSHESAG